MIKSPHQADLSLVHTLMIMSPHLCDSLYYVQSPDQPFNVTVMAGNGNIVSNVATLSWIASQYWIGGSTVGKSFAASPPLPGYTWIFNGAMPGTLSVLVQYITPR